MAVPPVDGRATTSVAPRGVWVALLTPFDEGGAVDARALTALVDHVVGQGVHGVVALGTTGEFADLGDDDRDLVTRTAVEAARGRVPVLAGIGGLGTGEACRNARRAERAGADAVLALPPLFWKLDDDGLFAHFDAVAAATSLPVLLYDIPLFVGASLSPELVRRVALELPQVIGIKLTVEDFQAVSSVLDAVKPVRPDFSVTVGFEHLTLPAVRAGADGAISGMANFLTPTLLELVAAVRRDDQAAADAAHADVMRLFSVYTRANPPVLALKVLSAAHGVPVGPIVRTPHLTDASAVERVREWVATVAPVAGRR